jgi:hypothetical protein
VEPGTRVEVRSRFHQRWSRGFEIYEQVHENGSVGYRIRRRSDGSVLPAVFDGDEVREERRRRETWWI